MLNYFYKMFKNERGGVVLGILAVTGIIALGIGLFSFGNKTVDYKKSKVDVTKYDDINASGDPGKVQEKNSDAFVAICVEGGKVVATTGDDTAILTIPQKLGLFDVKKDKSKNTEEENKIKTNLEKNNLPSDPLTVGISKVIKNNIKNNSALDTSSEEIDNMLIEIMKEIEEKEELIDSMDNGSGDDAYDDMEDISNLVDMVSSIEQILESNEKLADQKVIDLKSNLNLAESHKKYVEGLIEAYEDAEKKGGILSSTQGLSALKTDLEYTNQTIDNLKNEMQLHEDELKKEPDEETQDTFTDEEEPEEIIEDTKEAPTIKLKIVAGPTYSEADGVCYYRVKAEVTGDPYPEITLSKDDSGGAWGSDTVQINLKDGASYTLKATATNSEDSATDSINLPWGCMVEPMGSITLKGTGRLTGCINTDYYSITMKINLDTGNITGNISATCTQPATVIETDPDTGEEIGRYSINCSFRYSASISGKMNLETGGITASCSGKLVGTSGGLCSQVKDRYESFKLYGTLNESNTFASGTDDSGDYWSVSR